MTKEVYIVSLGTLTKPNITKSFEAFSELVQETYKFPLPKLIVSGAYFLDRIYYHTIDNYKLGNINTTEFRAKIAYQLGVENTKKIDSAWNSMCEITTESISKIEKIFKLQQEKHFKLVIVSATNPLQYNYIINNFELLNLKTRSDLNIVTSFQEHTLNLAKLAEKGVKDKGWDSSEYKVVSFDDRISEAALSLEYASYIFSKDFYDL